MKYIARNEDGAIVAVYQRPQPEMSLESMEDDAPELVAYLNPPPQPPLITTAEVVEAMDEVDKGGRTKLDDLLTRI